jgi:hypothetical protein
LENQFFSGKNHHFALVDGKTKVQWLWPFASLESIGSSLTKQGFERLLTLEMMVVRASIPERRRYHFLPPA